MWTKVEDGLPDTKDGTVAPQLLVCRLTPEGKRFPYICWYEKGMGFVDPDSMGIRACMYLDVTHWQHIPLPPENDESLEERREKIKSILRREREDV